RLAPTSLFGVCDFPAWRPQPKRASPCSPSLQGLNTETTEDLSDLCVKFFLATEDTEASPATYRSEQTGQNGGSICFSTRRAFGSPRVFSCLGAGRNPEGMGQMIYGFFQPQSRSRRQLLFFGGLGAVLFH